MRTIIHEGNGIITLNYMWLPTWLGMNSVAKKQIESKLAETFKGRYITDEELDKMDAEVIDVIVGMFKGFTGLKDYLDGLKFVGDGTGGKDNPPKLKVVP